VGAVGGCVYGMAESILKPMSGKLAMGLQAGVAQAAGLTALYVQFPRMSLLAMVSAAWVICYLSALHFFGGFEESDRPLYSQLWAFFGASMSWVLGHRIIMYGKVPQLILILSVVAYVCSVLYGLRHHEKLSKWLSRQVIALLIIVLLALLLLSNWNTATY
jgi:hypothetical protein